MDLKEICAESRRAEDAVVKEKTKSKRTSQTGAILRLIGKKSLRGPMSLTLVIAATFTFSGKATMLGVYDPRTAVRT